jgi:hypothetical protein
MQKINRFISKSWRKNCKKKDDAILFAKLPVLATLQADRKFTGALACN